MSICSTIDDDDKINSSIKKKLLFFKVIENIKNC